MPADHSPCPGIMMATIFKYSNYNSQMIGSKIFTLDTLSDQQHSDRVLLPGTPSHRLQKSQILVPKISETAERIYGLLLGPWENLFLKAGVPRAVGPPGG